jgi:hypothetical protein
MTTPEMKPLPAQADCPQCEGSGKMLEYSDGKGSKEYTCPACHGSGKYPQQTAGRPESKSGKKCMFCGQGENGGPLYDRGDSGGETIAHHWICLVEDQDKKIFTLEHRLATQSKAMELAVEAANLMAFEKFETPEERRENGKTPRGRTVNALYYALKSLSAERPE